jgi:hypothetical protein
LPSVASDTYFESISQVPYNVSRDFGQLAVNRHFKVGDDCAIAGAAIAVAAAPAPIAVKNWRRFICSSIWASARFLFHPSSANTSDRTGTMLRSRKAHKAEIT